MTSFWSRLKPSIDCLRKWGFVVIAIVHYRYAILFLLLLASWSALTIIAAPQSLVANAMSLETYYQLTLLGAVNYVAAVFCVALIRVLNSRSSASESCSCIQWLFGAGSKPWTWNQHMMVRCVAVVTPIVLAWHYGTEFEDPFYGTSPVGLRSHILYSGSSVIASIILGWAFLRGIAFAKSVVFGTQKDSDNFLPYENVDRLPLWGDRIGLSKVFQTRLCGYLDIKPIDVQLLFYVVLLIAIHVVLTRYFASQISPLIAAPIVIVLIIWIAHSVLMGLAYRFDKLRVPVLLVLFLVMLLMNWKDPPNHTLKTLTDTSRSTFNSTIHNIRQVEAQALLDEVDRVSAVKDASKGLEDIAWDAVSKRMSLLPDMSSEKKRIAVVVTCPGGGIHAAAWSSYVLQTLSQKYPRFRSSICVISGVSGGSVGTLYFSSVTYAKELSGTDENSQTDDAFKLATESSLEQISFGLMTDDLYGAFYPPFSVLDRGQRLEDTLHGRIPKSLKALTLNQWGNVAKDGKMPIVIFNATDAVTGRRILFDTIPTPSRKSNISLTSRPYNYRELLLDGEFDVLPTTGARASASFPYVSTFTSIEGGNEIGQNIAIGDGGYVDNEGIVTAVDWVQFLLERWSTLTTDQRPFDQILVVRIMPSINGDSLVPPKGGGLARNLRWLTGPLETISNVRGTSQAERGNLETDLAALYLTSPSIKRDESELPSTDEDNNIKVYGMSPSEELSKPANRIREEGARERYLEHLKTAAPEKWQTVTRQPEALNAESPVKAVVGPELVSPKEFPVYVVELPFEVSQTSQVIPLNWKLTKEQKGWYSAAWSRIETKQTEDMDLMERLFAD